MIINTIKLNFPEKHSSRASPGKDDPFGSAIADERIKIYLNLKLVWKDIPAAIAKLKPILLPSQQSTIHNTAKYSQNSVPFEIQKISQFSF